MKKTALNEIHHQLGAKMVEFAGFEMPIQYKGLSLEHAAVRNDVGLFDISHMGEILVTGPNARNFINRITTNDITRVVDGQCQYSVCCYEDGSVVDDVITYQFSPEKYLVVVNAANIEKDYHWFMDNKISGVDIINKSDDYAQLALQGPMACPVLQKLTFTPMNQLYTFRFTHTQIAGNDAIISRTGYTGEDGFEIYCDPENAKPIWEAIMEAGDDANIQPVGLGARDTLRLEMAYSLYGHEISEKINPLEARLQWVVKFNKDDFIGKKALEKIKQDCPARQLVGIQMTGKGIAREGYEVYFKDEKVGVVTSGTHSPTVGAPIALALIEAYAANTAKKLQVKVRDKLIATDIVSLPFYKKS
jgi:aminomethyltransferase